MPFAIGLLLRPALQKRWVLSMPDTRKPKRQMVLDFYHLPCGGDICVAAFNKLVHGFPAGSGLSIVFGCAGFWAFHRPGRLPGRERAVIRAAAVRTKFFRTAQLFVFHDKKIFVFCVNHHCGQLRWFLSMIIARDFAWLSQGASI